MSGKTVAYTVLFIFHLQFYPFRELMKMPVLLLHYSDYNTTATSFGVFLSHHYSHEADNDQDQEKDRHLPFKNTDHVQVGWTALIPAGFEELANKIMLMNKAEFLIIRMRGPMDFVCNFFHPPDGIRLIFQFI